MFDNIYGFVGYAAIENALYNRRTRIILVRNTVFDCHLLPVGRQMAIENSLSNDFYLRSSIVLTFSFAANPVWFLEKKSKTMFLCHYKANMEIYNDGFIDINKANMNK